MKQQLINRLGAAHIRDTVAQFVAGSITRAQAMDSLRIGEARLYQLRTSYLAAAAAGKSDAWTPGTSGGDHMPVWPEEVRRFLRGVLSPAAERRYTYAFAASEAGRKFGFPLDRSQVGHWAMENGFASAPAKPRPPAHVRRWQRLSVGELWQLDATPDYFLGRDNPSMTLIDRMDDCSRMQVGCRLYRRETVGSYLDLLDRAFSRYGLPLEIYVDKASFFRNDNGELTQLGKRLKFYDVSFVFANAPESKGKIERVHQMWQDRLPAFAAYEGITADTPLEDVNDHLDLLVDHRNGFEIHREIHARPLEAWDCAVREGRCKIRQPPRDGWWELIWAEWKGAVIGPRGRLLVGDVLCPTECANGTRVWTVRHLDGTLSLVLNKPAHDTPPQIAFTTNPRVNRG